MLISANRDESHFAEPDVLDLTRDPNPHLAFAFGAHFCLGNRLARLEGQLAFEALAQRFTGIRLAPGAEIAYKPTQSLRGLRSLPVLLDPAYLRAASRSEERSVGKECVSTCRLSWSPNH